MSEPTKKCNRCLEVLLLWEFKEARSKQGKTYRTNVCKPCINRMTADRRRRKKKKTCSQCGETKSLTEFYFLKRGGHGYYPAQCKACKRQVESNRARKAREQRAVERMEGIADPLITKFLARLPPINPKAKEVSDVAAAIRGARQ